MKTKYPSVLENEYIEQLHQMMKPAAFWKYAAFGIVCIRQELEIYKSLAVGRRFDMSRFLQKTVERFWKAAATGYSMDEQYLLAVEESFFTPRDGWEELALQVVQDLHQFFYAVAQKDGRAALRMQRCQTDLIRKYLLLAEVSPELGKQLETRAGEQKLALAQELAAIPNKEKKPFLKELADREWDSLLEEGWTAHCPAVKKEKPEKKKLPEIRPTSLDFDREKKERDYTWLLESDPEQWVLGKNRDAAAGAYRQAWHQRELLDLCYKMKVRYQLLAEADYVSNRKLERVRGFWYLAALTCLRAYQLWEKGYPVHHPDTKYYLERYEKGEPGFSPVFSWMLYAYASGEDWLLSEIQHFSKEWERSRSDTLLRLLTSEEGSLLVPLIEEWEEEPIKQTFLAILQGNTKEVRKIILHRIRQDRKQYELYRTMVDAQAYACLRLAGERGLSMEPLRAAEVLDGEREWSPLDKSYWRLPYQEDIQKWLENSG